MIYDDNPFKTQTNEISIQFSHLISNLLIAAEADNEEPEEDSSEDDSKKKKKREAPKSLETVRSDKKKTSSEAKPFQWSDIFGIDRKKKSTGLIYHPLQDNDRRRKRCGPGECGDAEDYSKCSGKLIKG
jgi:hypothetical protein